MFGFLSIFLKSTFFLLFFFLNFVFLSLYLHICFFTFLLSFILSFLLLFFFLFFPSTFFCPSYVSSSESSLIYLFVFQKKKFFLSVQWVHQVHSLVSTLHIKPPRGPPFFLLKIIPCLCSFNSDWQAIFFIKKTKYKFTGNSPPICIWSSW